MRERFEDAARAEAEQRVMGSSLFAHTTRGLLVGMALWARAHLVEQEASDAEVEAAADAILEAAFGQELPEAPIDLARAALRAAARIRKEQER